VYIYVWCVCVSVWVCVCEVCVCVWCVMHVLLPRKGYKLFHKVNSGYLGTTEYG